MPDAKQIKILIVVPGVIPSITIGILLPLFKLEQQGVVKLKLVFSGMFPCLIKPYTRWSDIVIFSRNCELYDLKYLYTAKQLNKKVIYEIDDNFFNIQLNTEQGRYHRSFQRLYVIKRFLELSDLVRVYSSELYSVAKKYEANVELKKLYFYNDAIKRSVKTEKKGALKIVYPTTRIDEDRLEQLIYSALKTILQKYGNRVELHLWKTKVPEILSGEPGVVLHPAERSYSKFIKHFYTAGYDIGLAPTIEHPFYYAKTNNKYREYAGCGVPAVYTNALPYSDCVHDGENGLLANNTVDSWVSKISELIDNTFLRNKIVENASRDIQLNYQFDSFLNVWSEDINRVFSAISHTSIYTQEAGPVAKVICFVDDDNDDRISSITRVTNLLGVSLDWAGWLDFPAAHCIKPVGAIFIINSTSRFEYITEICNQFRFAVFDFSRFEGDLNEIKSFMDLIDLPGLSVILHMRDISLNDWFLKIGIKYLVVNGDSSNYHLDSYCGVYLEMLENRCTNSTPSFFTDQFRIRAMRNFFKKVLARLLRIIIFMKWTLGVRFL